MRTYQSVTWVEALNGRYGPCYDECERDGDTDVRRIHGYARWTDEHVPSADGQRRSLGGHGRDFDTNVRNVG